jgi:ABC-type glycerol-3-phosphate transport system substrate-binding protein
MPKRTIIFAGIGVFFVLIIAAVYAFSSGGKKPANNQPVELVWWKTFEDPQNIQELINAYQETHKNVTIRYVKKDVTTYEQELVDAIASGNGPDIMTIHNDWLPKHIGKLAPAPDSVITERQYRDTFMDVASDDFIRDGKIYAMPLSVDVLALYYNKDILNSVGISTPPKTWPEIESAVQKITRQDQNGDFIRSGMAMGLASNVNRAADVISLLMLQDGTQFYSSSQDVTLDAPVQANGSSYNPAAEALAYYSQFANPAKKDYTWNAKASNSVDAFSQGKLGMMLSYSYMRDMILDKAPSLNWGVSDAPQTAEAAATGSRVNFANYWGEAVSKSSKNQAVAWDFLNFITQKDVLAKFYAKHPMPASRKDMIESQYSDINLGVFAENVPTAKSVYKQDADIFEGVFIKMIEDVILRNLKPEEAVQNAAQQLRLIPKS